VRAISDAWQRSKAGISQDLDFEKLGRHSAFYAVVVLLSIANPHILRLLPWTKCEYDGLPSARLLLWATLIPAVLEDLPQLCAQIGYLAVASGGTRLLPVATLSVTILSLCWRLIRRQMVGMSASAQKAARKAASMASFASLKSGRSARSDDDANTSGRPTLALLHGGSLDKGSSASCVELVRPPDVPPVIHIAGGAEAQHKSSGAAPLVSGGDKTAAHTVVPSHRHSLLRRASTGASAALVQSKLRSVVIRGAEPSTPADSELVSTSSAHHEADAPHESESAPVREQLADPCPPPLAETDAPEHEASPRAVRDDEGGSPSGSSDHGEDEEQGEAQPKLVWGESKWMRDLKQSGRAFIAGAALLGNAVT
jgi:hypothetical protein